MFVFKHCYLIMPLIVLSSFLVRGMAPIVYDNSLHNTIYTVDYSKFIELLDVQKISPESRNEYGEPIIAAACNEDSRFLKKLIECGVNVNSSAERGYTSLHAASECNETIKNVKLLLKAGANIEAKNGDTTPLRWALDEYMKRDKCKKIVKALIERGANIAECFPSLLAEEYSLPSKSDPTHIAKHKWLKDLIFTNAPQIRATYLKNKHKKQKRNIKQKRLFKN